MNLDRAKIVRMDEYRSPSKNVNDNYDMVRVTVDVPIIYKKEFEWAIEGFNSRLDAVDRVEAIKKSIEEKNKNGRGQMTLQEQFFILTKDYVDKNRKLIEGSRNVDALLDKRIKKKECDK